MTTKTEHTIDELRVLNESLRKEQAELPALLKAAVRRADVDAAALLVARVRVLPLIKTQVEAQIAHIEADELQRSVDAWQMPDDLVATEAAPRAAESRLNELKNSTRQVPNRELGAHELKIRAAESDLEKAQLGYHQRQHEIEVFTADLSERRRQQGEQAAKADKLDAEAAALMEKLLKGE